MGNNSSSVENSNSEISDDNFDIFEENSISEDENLEISSVEENNCLNNTDKYFDIDFDYDMNDELNIKNSNFDLKFNNNINIEYTNFNDLEKNFLKSLLYTDLVFSINKDYTLNNDLEKTIVSDKTIRFLKVNNNVRSIINILLKNKPVLFKYNIFKNIEISNWISTTNDKKLLLNSKCATIIGFDMEFNTFKIFDGEENYYFPFYIFKNDNVIYEMFTYKY